MFSTDTLTISRINRLFQQHDLDGIPINVDNPELTTIILGQLHGDLLNKICNILHCNIEKENDAIKCVSEFIEVIGNETELYLTEIDKRKKYVSDELMMWKEDDEVKEDEKFYQNDYYLSCFKVLSEHNINPSELTLYESLILTEELICADMAKGIFEMISIFEDKYKTIALDFKDKLKHANFVSFMVDIFDAVEQIYKEYTANAGK